MTKRSCVVSNCCVISGHRPGSLRQHLLIFLPFIGQMSRHTLAGFLSQHLPSYQWRISLGCLSFLKYLSPGRVYLPRIDPQRKSPYLKVPCLETIIILANPVFSSSFIMFAEKAMAPNSSTLAWKIPWTEEPGGLSSMGSYRVGHD